MKIAYRLENVDNIDATLTMTMSICDWEDFASQIPMTGGPALPIGKAIRAVIYNAKQSFEGAEEYLGDD